MLLVAYSLSIYSRPGLRVCQTLNLHHSEQRVRLTYLYIPHQAQEPVHTDHQPTQKTSRDTRVVL